MNDLHRIRMIIEYDGSAYHGFQRQATVNTIQAELEKALARLTGEEPTVMGAGRTDAGVHALGQVIAFDTCSTIPEDRWPIALNTFLPGDIRVLGASSAEPDFHPQFSAKRKKYLYKIYRSEAATAFYRKYALCLNIPLDLAEMRRAASYIEGTHNFKAFCASGSNVKSYVRTVSLCRLEDSPCWLNLVIEANGFLYNMVRIIIGTLLQIGQGKKTADCIPQLIASQDRTLAGYTAAPQGLYMARVDYRSKI